MPQTRIDEIKTLYPNAIPDWNRMKLRMIIKQKALLKKVKDMIRTSPRIDHTENKFLKVKKAYYKSGLHVITPWPDFVDRASLETGSGCCPVHRFDY